MAQLFKRIEEGDLTDWPLDRFAAAKIVTVRLVSGPEQIINKNQRTTCSFVGGAEISTHIH